MAVLLNRKLQPAAARLTVLLLLAGLFGAARAQQPHPASLPLAPSFVLAHQAFSPASFPAQTPGSALTFTPSATMAGPGGTAIELPQSSPLPLSLDDAIGLALHRNVRIRYDLANLSEVQGDRLAVVNALLPTLTATASSGAQEINLAAMGFKPSLLAGSGILPPGYVFSNIVKVNTTQATLSASQQLFNLSAYELYLGSRRESDVVHLNLLSGHGDVIMAVAQAYLKVLADQTNLTNARAEQRSSKSSFDQASERLNAGVGIRLDALRAQVDFQQHEQAAIAAQDTLAKDIIQLDRIMGLPAGQQLDLTDAAPFAQLADIGLDQAKATAYIHRKDLLSLQAEIEVDRRELRAVKYQRLPTLAFNGFYGVLGQTGVFYHGVFSAEGSLRFPIFHEAAQRGEQDEVSAQISALLQREADLRVSIDAQIRASMLDVNAADKLVKVAQSNVKLAQQELSDERDRFTAGVDTNLAVLDAQAAVTGADAQLVSALYQYNVAKLGLARNTGVIESRYRSYLGK